MIIYQTIKRTMRRAVKPLNRWIGYTDSRGDGPGLNCILDGEYKVVVTFRDLAFLVRAADEHAAKDGVPTELVNWRDLQ